MMWRNSVDLQHVFVGMNWMLIGRLWITREFLILENRAVIYFV